MSIIINKLKKRLWFLAIKISLYYRVKINNVIILSSSPRSGSTWLSNVLKAIPHSFVIFEPLHIVHVPEAQRAGFSMRTYVPVSSKWPRGRDFLQRIFRGKIINEWTSREMSLHEARNAEMMIIKFVRANRLLPWICHEFNVRAVILLIRHPCGVIASQMKSKDWSTSTRPEIPPYLDEFPVFKSVVSNTQGTEEHLAALWALDQMPALLHGSPHPWIIISYEELFLRPEKTIEKISKACNLPIDMNDALSKIGWTSSVTYKSGISGFSGWKKQLSEKQVSQIIKTVHALGLTFYADGLEPDYELLNSPKLAEMIRQAGRNTLDSNPVMGLAGQGDSQSEDYSNVEDHPGNSQRDFVAVSGSIIAPPSRRWCGPELKDDNFYIQSAEKEADRLVAHFQCSQNTRVLDIGCGQGRLPIGILRKIGEISYLGIDIDKRSIDWCRQYIERDHPSFLFQHLNVYNERYNKDGIKIDDGFRFDIESGAFDIIYLFSVFSHTTEEDMRNYLREFSRILDKGGKIFFTTFVEENVPSISINPDGYRLKCSGPLHIVRYNKYYLFSILHETGFAVKKYTHATELDGQSALYLQKT